MLKAYKTEINPTPQQQVKIQKTIGTCRYIYNFYLDYNKKVYEAEKRFVTANEFSKWLNNVFLPDNPDLSWIKEVSSKAVKQAMCNGEKAFKKFFKKKSGFPKFKKKKDQSVKAYLPKNNPTDWTVERHRVKIPTFGFVRLKEKGYIPVNAKVISGTVSYKAGRYYVSVLCDVIVNNADYSTAQNTGMGIDLGIKELAIVSSFVKPFININKTKQVKRLEKKLKREQRKLSRKYESLKKRNKINKKEGGTATRQNISKQVVQVQILHQKLNNIRDNYINQVVSEIVKTKPSYITIEDLNVSGMMKNRHLSKAIQKQKFYQFRTKLTSKCNSNNIELRIVDRFYPSSKLCSDCGNVKKNLQLSDRTYICEKCGIILDRDKNASINLANAKIYKIA